MTKVRGPREIWSPYYRIDYQPDPKLITVNLIGHQQMQSRQSPLPALRDAITSHLAETETHVERLEQVFALLDEKPRGKHCAGMAGIIEEGQRAEHYEMAAYGTCIAWAEALGLSWDTTSS